MMGMQRTWLPSRPLALAPGKLAGGWVLVVLMLAIAGVMAYAAVDAVLDLGRMEHEQRIWDTGEDGARPTVAVRVHDRLVVSYDLDVGYADDDGVYQTHTQHLSLIGLGIDTAHEPSVHYDPTEPSDFAVSWAIAAREGRRRYSLIGGSAFGLAALLALWVASAIVRAIVRQRELARSGDDAAVVVVSIKQRGGRLAHLFDVAWRADASAQPVRITAIDSRRGNGRVARRRLDRARARERGSQARHPAALGSRIRCG